MKSLRFKIAIGILLVVVGLQFLGPVKTNPKVEPSKEIKVPPHIEQIFKNSCYDCHSSETKWPWYSNIAPVSWFVVRHVNDGRKWLNFSEWENYDEAKKMKLKKLIFREVALAMPLHGYTIMHPSAALSPEDKNAIREWSGVKASDVSMRD